ncbi:1,4-dihydroxy-2-naphthoate octaprenyltransferase [Bacillus sp. SG-1]|nr:1,4-dihydroxy-2-naphthoate octaprenyltransferase [Bacillus sp. SG-1]
MLYFIHNEQAGNIILRMENIERAVKREAMFAWKRQQGVVYRVNQKE